MLAESIPAGQKFCLNAPKISSDSADGEVIILNLETGAYYGLEREGAAIWEWILAGKAFGETVAAMAEASGIPPEQAESALQAFLAELLQEEILLPYGGMQEGAGSAVGPLAFPGDNAFAPPSLNKYTDMQELLMIDPVHDVDDRGWPNLPVNDA